MKKGLLFFSLAVSSLHAYSEDIDLYLSELQEEVKPQVLLIVDTSGSMDFTESIKTPFDPAQSYQVQTPSFTGTGDSYLYYVVGESDDLPAVDAPNEHRRFLASINNCSAAQTGLDEVGFYTGRVREYTFAAGASFGSWQELSATQGQTISIIDCQDDVNLDLETLAAGGTAAHNINQIGGNGYPVDAVGTPSAHVYYDTDVTNSNATWTGELVTLYTDEYLRWEQGTQLADGSDIGETIETRLTIAQRTLGNLIDSIPSVKFGLEVYNVNVDQDTNQDGNHGGRVVFGIQDMTAAAKTSLKNIINIDLHASGATPLCESYYEAYRYFSGSGVLYGDNDETVTVNAGGALESLHEHDRPDRDTSIESGGTAETGGTYISPFTDCSNKTYVILITDGVPSTDNAADGFIQGLAALANATAGTVDADGASTDTSFAEKFDHPIVPIDGNYLPVLAAYMSTNDLNTNLPGVQTTQLYTVGFGNDAGDAAEVLDAAATNGGGVYYPATDPTKLGAQLIKAISSIFSINTSFTSPAVATNSFDRTETLDSAYFAMFTPTDTARWTGNLKKLKVKDGELVGRDTAVAVVDGVIIDNAKTFWAENPGDPDAPADGNEVSQGGVVGMFNNKTDARKVYSDIGTASALTNLTYDNLETSFTSETLVNTMLGLATTDSAKEYLNWGLGIESTNTSTSTATYTYRSNLFGDPLHSKPVTINYGGTSGNQDVRILVGTNAGVLHMFKDSGATVDETWAFMPKELLPNIKPLRDNLASSNKIYGVDGRITTHIVDNNGDGTINGTDTAWVFFGLRRGGSSYYALNVTSPDDPDGPELLWKIDTSTSGFEKLGQTWSQPRIGFSSINIEGNTPKPVLIFGGGYSITKDSDSPGSSNDTVGNGIYMVDAETGTLLWSATPEAASEKNTQFEGFTDSIPSRIGVLDSDGDGLIDRLYTGDTGGNVFRVDMPGNDPDSSTTPWTVFKLAELGGASEFPRTNLNDRRFFDAPSIVRTFFTDTFSVTVDSVETVYSQETPYEAILIGSGDRTSPKDTATNDEFFMIQDENVITQSFVENAVAPAKEPPTAITYDNLFDFTSDPYDGVLTPAQLRDLDIAISGKSGWRYNYAGAGEKSTAGAIVIDGVAFFTSYTPGIASADNVCEVIEGEGNLYAIDLYKGTTILTNRKTVILTTLPDTPVLISSPTDDDSGTDPDDPDAPPGIAKTPLLLLTGGPAIPVGATLRTSRSYQYVTENQ